jgi:hypothetical protein
MSDFCRDLSTTSCGGQQNIIWVLNTEGLTTQRCRSLTFIHCSAWRIASKWRATAAGPTRSSANSLIPPRLLVAAPDIGAERIGSASWISGERTTTYRVDSNGTSSRSPSATAGASPPATSIGSGAPPAAPWVSSARPSTGTASGMALPPASAPVNKRTTGLVIPGGYDYSTRLLALVQSAHPLRCWPPTMSLPRPAPRTLLEGRERTSQRSARILLQPPLHWVHLRPRLSPWISCRVHNWLSTQYDYQIKCTTREGSSLTGSTGLLSRLGRRGYW